jgi:hypothetical protein
MPVPLTTDVRLIHTGHARNATQRLLSRCHDPLSRAAEVRTISRASTCLCVMVAFDEPENGTANRPSANCSQQ